MTRISTPAERREAAAAYVAARSTIPVAEPAFVGREREYVLDCIDAGWISSAGEYVERFEHSFASYCQVEHAMTVCNGTAAIHLALAALGIGPGDEVLVPSLTYVATANAVSYCGARPVLLDSEFVTGNIDVGQIERRITPRTKAIVVVHLFGHPVDMDPVTRIARRHGLFVIEDAAEAHGALYKGRIVGTLGDIATFSFYGNKILTTGEGGMVVTNDARVASRVRQLRGQGMDPGRRYWFPIIGYNYRMTNIAAALGLAQLEQVDWHTEQRQRVHATYAQLLHGVPGLRLIGEEPWARSAFWMSSIVLESGGSVERDAVMARLSREGIESRPFFFPMHQLPMYASDERFPVADSLAARGMNLPSSARLSRPDIERVCEALADEVQTIIAAE